MINSKVINILGIVAIFLGISMIPSLGWSLYYSEPDSFSFIKALLITIISGLFLYFTTKTRVKKCLIIISNFSNWSIQYLPVILF